ncbi:hypothetical protein P3S68_026949 [Capsicum galapagoense]
MVKILFGVQYTVLDIGGHEKVMKETAKEIDIMLEDWLAEHRRRKKLRVNKSEDEEDFMDVMMFICEDKDIPGHFDADTIVKATCMVMLSAGVDTTLVTLTWTLSLLLNNDQSLKRAQDELDTHVGKIRRVQESDIKNLVYLQAIVKESLRLYSPVPLMLPHEPIEDCVVSGYDIPKGTRLLVNISKFHRDPKIWPNPHDGRRICPGISLALQVVKLLAVLLQEFEIKRPLDEPIDMSESFGLTMLKASPLEVHLTPRLDSNLYD